MASQEFEYTSALCNTLKNLLFLFQLFLLCGLLASCKYKNTIQVRHHRTMMFNEQCSLCMNSIPSAFSLRC